MLSMPNEVGWVGLVNLVGQPLMRRRPYDGFFARPMDGVRFAAAVTVAATSSGSASHRAPAAPHLGLDHRSVAGHNSGTFVDTGLWQLEARRRSALGANLFIVARRAR